MANTLHLKAAVSTPKTINRGVNPFAPIAKIQNQNLSNSTKSKYVDMPTRIAPLVKSQKILDSIANLKNRLKNNVYTQIHFGRLMEIDCSLIDFNVDIQRLVEEAHIAVNIIEKFDPRIMQPLNVIFIKETGRYSSWEGQQSGCAFALMQHFGLIAPGTKIQCKVVDDDLTVPGSKDKGEAVGNYGFRQLGGSGRKPIGAFYVHRSRVNGVRLYGSTQLEDVQSEAIQKVLESHNMYPSASVQGQKKKPGMITYISGLNNIAHHGTQDPKTFKKGLADLEWALKWHDTYFPYEDGVDGGHILAFGRLSAEARANGVDLTPALEQDLYEHYQKWYSSPAGFHRDCKERLKKFQKKNKLKDSWSDSCLTPILVMDYINRGGAQNVPQVAGMVIYAGI
jgi:hypothetical protein